MSFDICSQTLEIPAFGRNFQLGGLYDRRTDTLVAGFSLWDRAQLEAPHLSVTRNNHTSYKLIASDKLSEKLENLDVKGSLQLSILSGLTDIDGSASFLRKKTNSRRESTIYIRCHHRTVVKSLTMEHLGKDKIPHLDVAKTGANNLATHVVTQIQYGANATFTFRKRNNQTQTEREISGKLKACGNDVINVLTGASTLQCDVQNIAAHESGNNADIECKFEGDFIIPQNIRTPTNYEEAIKFAGEFSQVLSQSIAKDTAPGNEPLGLPCLVTLYPLAKLPEAEGAPFHQTEISDILTFDYIHLMENYEELEEEVQDLLNDSLGSRISPFRKKLEFFQKKFTSFRIILKTKLSEILVEIRSGRSEIASLAQLLGKIQDEQFIFNPHRIKLWLAEKHHELCMVKRFQDTLIAEGLDHENRVLIFPTEKKEREHMTASNVRHAIHFVFTSMALPEFFMQLDVTTLLNFGDAVENDDRRLTTVDHHLGWHRNHTTVESIEEEMLYYIQFVKANIGDKRVVFSMTALVADDQTCSPGSSVFVYENGTLSKKNYELPGIPHSFNAELDHNLGPRISFLPPAKGEILRYRVTTGCPQLRSFFVEDPFIVLSRQDLIFMVRTGRREFTVTAECLYGSGPSYIFLLQSFNHPIIHLQ